jgi:hypothetical protein
MVFATLRMRCSFLAALAGHIACLIWLGAVANFGFPLFPAVLFTLAATLLVACDLERVSNPYRITVAGSCLGLTALFRYDVGGLVAVALTGILISAIFIQKFHHGRTYSLFLFWVGVSVVFAPAVAVYLLSGGKTLDFVGDVFHSAIVYVQTRRLPFPSLNQIWINPTELAVYIPPVVLLATLLFAASHRRDGAKVWIVAAFASVCVAFYIKGWVRISLIHISGALVFALALLPILWTAGGARLRALVALCAIFAAVPTFFALNKLVSNIERNRGFLMNFFDSGDTSCGSPAHLRHVSCLEVTTQWSEAVKFLVEHVPPDQRLFSGLTRHDKIFVNDIMIYFASQRLPATRWHHYDPGLQTRADIQSAMIAEFDRQALHYIVLESDWDSVAEPNVSAVSSGVTILDDYIRARYEMVRQFGTISVLTRRK